MTFGEALEAVKAGKRAQRAGWNGKGMWIAHWRAGTYGAGSEVLENCPALVAYAQSTRSKTVDIAGALVLRAADGSIVIGWLASQTDMLADDWSVCD